MNKTTNANYNNKLSINSQNNSFYKQQNVVSESKNKVFNADDNLVCSNDSTSIKLQEQVSF